MRLFSAEILRSKIVYAVFALAPLVAMAVADEQQKAPPTTAQIAAWVRDLGAAQFDVREQAEKSLLAAGEAAIEPLAAILDSKDPEVRLRAKRTYYAVLIALEDEALMGLEQLGAVLLDRDGKTQSRDHEVRAAAIQRVGKLAANDFTIAFSPVAPGVRLVGQVKIKNNVKIKDDDLRWLRSFRHLRFLELSDTPIGDEAMQHVASCANLVHLRLDKTKIGDDGIALCSKLHDLTYLDVSDTSIHGTGVAHLVNNSSLTYLVLIGCPINDDGCRAIGQLVQIEGLLLNRSTIGDKGLSQFSKMRKLRTLSLAETAITDDGLMHLCKLAALASVSLEATSITDAGIASLVAMPALSQLNISKTAVTDACSFDLVRMPALSQLNLNNTKLSLVGLTKLHDATKLKYLYALNLDLTKEEEAKLRSILKNVSVFPIR